MKGGAAQQRATEGAAAVLSNKMGRKWENGAARWSADGNGSGLGTGHGACRLSTRLVAGNLSPQLVDGVEVGGEGCHLLASSEHVEPGQASNLHALAKLHHRLALHIHLQPEKRCKEGNGEQARLGINKGWVACCMN